MQDADDRYVSKRAKHRGISQVRARAHARAPARGRAVRQLGTLGAGNHYAEIQAVEEIYDRAAARAMGITEVGQICIMIHRGSRGLGHQVASGTHADPCPRAGTTRGARADYIALMQHAMQRDGIRVRDRQVRVLACAPHGAPGVVRS